MVSGSLSVPLDLESRLLDLERKFEQQQLENRRLQGELTVIRNSNRGLPLYPSMLEEDPADGSHSTDKRLLQQGKEPSLKSLLAFREISFRGYRCQKRIIKCVEARKSLEIFLFVLMLVSKHCILVLFYHFCCIVATTIKITTAFETFISILVVILIVVATLHINRVELKIMYIRHTITSLIVL